ncbi:MAG: hypothetical protein V7707_04180 [Motiliproteus sp.]
MSDDDILDSYLSGDSDISALYQESTQNPKGPSADTDQAVLAAAKRSIGTGPSVKNRRLRPSWLIPASAAATIVLSTSIYLTNQPLLDSASDFDPSGYNGSYDQADNSAAESESLQPLHSKQANQPELQQQQRSLLTKPQSMKAEALTEQTRARPEKKKTALADAPALAPQMSASEANEEASSDSLSNSRIGAEQIVPADTMSADPLPTEPLSAAKEAHLAEPKQRAPQPTAPQALTSVPQNYRSTIPHWLAEIERLIDQGELTIALDELETFQREHPNHPLPEQIRAFQQSQQP